MMDFPSMMEFFFTAQNLHQRKQKARFLKIIFLLLLRLCNGSRRAAFFTGQ